MMSDLSVAEKLVMSTDHGLSGHLESYSRRSFHLLKKCFVLAWFSLNIYKAIKLYDQKR